MLEEHFCLIVVRRMYIQRCKQIATFMCQFRLLCQAVFTKYGGVQRIPFGMCLSGFALLCHRFARCIFLRLQSCSYDKNSSLCLERQYFPKWISLFRQRSSRGFSTMVLVCDDDTSNDHIIVLHIHLVLLTQLLHWDAN